MILKLLFINTLSTVVGILVSVMILAWLYFTFYTELALAMFKAAMGQ
jgi:hypothetical protein